jgi:hypothetical protein
MKFMATEKMKGNHLLTWFKKNNPFSKGLFFKSY